MIRKQGLVHTVGNHRVSIIAGLLFFVLGFLSLVIFSDKPYIIFTAFGFIAVSILCIPFALNKNQSIISTWTFFCLSVIIGCFLRGIYIGFNYPDPFVITHMFTLNRPPDEFTIPTILVLISLSLTAISYSLSRGSRKRSSFFAGSYAIVSTKLYVFAFFALIASIVSIVAYIQLTGGLDLENLSRKRSTISSLELDSQHRTWQSLRTIASISMLAHLFVLYDALKSRRRRSTKLCFAFILLLLSLFLPFYTSIRSEVVVYLIFSFLVIYSAGVKLPISKGVVYFLVAILLFQFMSLLRSNKDMTFGEIGTALIDTALFDSVILSRNGAELGKTAHIINAVPNSLDLMWGKTIGVWLLAPIPREIWNNKPLISPGPVIGTIIYGNRVSGVPPGLYAELFWNFSFIGLFAGSVLFGLSLKWIDTRYSPTGPNLVVFIYGPLQIGHMIVGVSIGYGVINILIRTAVAIVVFRYISKKLR